MVGAGSALAGANRVARRITTVQTSFAGKGLDKSCAATEIDAQRGQVSITKRGSEVGQYLSAPGEQETTMNVA